MSDPRSHPDPAVATRAGAPTPTPAAASTTSASATGPRSADRLGDDVGLPSRPTATELLEDALFETKRVLVGQDRMLERLLVCALARGHVLLEGAPGLAKTLAAETMARVIDGSFKRIQFTPDLMPADLVGTRVYRPSHEGLLV